MDLFWIHQELKGHVAVFLAQLGGYCLWQEKRKMVLREEEVEQELQLE
jgi:hypothetical protein